MLIGSNYNYNNKQYDILNIRNSRTRDKRVKELEDHPYPNLNFGSPLHPYLDGLYLHLCV